LDALVAARKIDWQWVKGHGGEKYNEMCDTLARERATDSSEDLV
jgi:ribonuclease HI